jgi:molybdopterin biosynthesis enzyme MoaB
VGKGAVEKAASWKSPTTGLSHSAWKSRKSGGISHFFHRHDYGGFIYLIFPARGIAELQRASLVCCLPGQKPSSREISYSTAD